MKSHKISKNGKETWGDALDYDFIGYLTKEIALLDPTENCKFKSNKLEWVNLPKSKSLFHTDNNCGLPIGNLTSQLFSNIYLNKLDQYIKRDLKCKYYGRYVDDFYIVSSDKNYLKKLVPAIRCFLKDVLSLDLHMGKTQIFNAKYGVEFLGAYIKPNRTYIANKCLKRIASKLFEFQHCKRELNVCQAINSILGVFSHYRSNKLKLQIFKGITKIQDYGFFDKQYSKFFPNEKKSSKKC